MWETDVLTLCIGCAMGFLLAQFIERRDKGILPGLFDIACLIIVVLLGLFAINANYLFREGNIFTFFNANFIDILQAGGTIGLGASSVYLTQRLYEEMRKSENIDEIIAPLYFEIEKIREYLQLHDYDWGYLHIELKVEWEAMENTALEIRAKNIDSRIPEFYKRLSLHRKKYDAVHKYFHSKIDELFEKELLPTGEEYHIPFHFTFKTGYESPKMISHYKYLIFGLNPISLMKKIEDTFEENKCIITFGQTDKTGYGDREQHELKYIDIERKCENFYAAVENLLSANPEIIALRRERKNLIKTSTEIHDNLGKKII